MTPMPIWKYPGDSMSSISVHRGPVIGLASPHLPVAGADLCGAQPPVVGPNINRRRFNGEKTVT